MNARLHSGLSGYLLPAARTAVNAPESNPRLPVQPAGALPKGPSPFANTSQTNKKTNATIVYARTAVNTIAFGGLNRTIAEGDVAFVERLTHPKRRLATDDGKVVRVYTLEQINSKFADMRVPTDTGKELSDFFSVDGVTNNLDGLDEQNEFRDFAIANVALQGPCRLAVSADEAKKVQIGDVLYIGLQVIKRDDKPEDPSYKLELFRFFSSEVTRLKTKPTDKGGLDLKLENTKLAWAVGRIIDTHQSHRMLTINVGVAHVQEITDAMLDLVMTDKRREEISREDKILKYKEEIDRRRQGVVGVLILEVTVEQTVRDQLQRRWRRAEERSV